MGLHLPFLGAHPPLFGIPPPRRCRSRAALAGWSGTKPAPPAPNPLGPPGDALGGSPARCPPPMGALPSRSAARSPNKGGGGGDAGLPRLLPAPAPAAPALPSPRSPSSPGKSEVSCWARAKLGGAASSSLLGIYRRERLGKGPRHLLLLLLLFLLLLSQPSSILHPRGRAPHAEPQPLPSLPRWILGVPPCLGGGSATPRSRDCRRSHVSCKARLCPWGRRAPPN